MLATKGELPPGGSEFTRRVLPGGASVLPHPSNRAKGSWKQAAFYSGGGCESSAESGSETLASDDQLLMIRGMQGDANAFEALLRRFSQPLVRFATRALGDPTEAEDVAQIVFIQAFKQSRQFRFECSVSSWLFAIARNVCRNEIRRRSRLRKHFAESSETDVYAVAISCSKGMHDGEPKAVIARELERKIRQAMDDLPARQRTAIHLLLERDLSYEEISILERTSVATTKALIHRGRQTLRQTLRLYLRSADTRERVARIKRAPANSREKTPEA
jgi:RNA polymerase sigma-70 factor, ECF subfamily